MADCQADESEYEPVTYDVLLTAVSFVIELLEEGKTEHAIRVLKSAEDRLMVDVTMANRQEAEHLTLH